MNEPVRMRTTFKSPLSVLNPKSIAIVGASERARWPQDIFNNLRAGGYPGKVYAVNPRAREVWGLPCYPDLAALPEPVEHALVIVPAPAVLDVQHLGFWASNGSGRTSNESGGRPTDLLDVHPTCWTSARLIGRPATLLDVQEGVLGVHNRPHFPLMW